MSTEREQLNRLGPVGRSLLGLALGDCLGAGVEGWNREAIRASNPDGRVHHFRYEPMVWTDDTQQALTLIEATKRLGDPDPRWVATRWVAMDDQRLHRGTGSGFRSSVAAFAGDADPEMSGRTDRAGNGAAMRIAPTAIATRNQTDDAFVDQLVAVSLITHREIRALSGMLAVAYVARACAEHSNTPSPAEARKVLEDLLVWLPRQEAKLAEHPAVVDAGERLHEISDAFAGVLDRWDTEWSSIQAQIESFASVRRGSVTRLGEGFVTASVVGAVAWSLASRSSLQDRLIEAVGFGDDADTFAAMVGGLTGPWTNPQALLGRWGTMAGSDELIAWGRSLDSDVPTDTLPDLVELETRLTALVRAG